ncbi:MAG TPA: 50S ribosomal protein L19 [Phycisphaerae bacterium]|nr:50S ribosomal protein L19 [Phycisphaerae bacterium]
MRKRAIERVEAEHLAKALPEFRIGDLVDVGVKIEEGGKERVQVFTGRVIARRGKGATETFTVRRDTVGAERTFPLHSPHLAFVRVTSSHKVRRAKLHYLRQRVGKATRLSEEHREDRPGKAAAPQAEANEPNT